MQRIKAIFETILCALGGSLLGGFTGWLLGNALKGEAIFERIFLFWGGILLGTLLAFWLTVSWMSSISLSTRSTMLVAGIALLLSGIALGIFTGPLQPYVPVWMLPNEARFWLPFVPVVAPLLAATVVGVSLPYQGKKETPTTFQREYPTPI